MALHSIIIEAVPRMDFAYIYSIHRTDVQWRMPPSRRTSFPYSALPGNACIRRYSPWPDADFNDSVALMVECPRLQVVHLTPYNRLGAGEQRRSSSTPRESSIHTLFICVAESEDPSLKSLTVFDMPYLCRAHISYDIWNNEGEAARPPPELRSLLATHGYRLLSLSIVTNVAFEEDRPELSLLALCPNVEDFAIHSMVIVRGFPMIPHPALKRLGLRCFPIYNVPLDLPEFDIYMQNILSAWDMLCGFDFPGLRLIRCTNLTSDPMLTPWIPDGRHTHIMEAASFSAARNVRFEDCANQLIQAQM